MQSFLLHGLRSSGLPRHGMPPTPGAGSVQVRYRLSSPSPHDLEQRDQGVQSVHSPGNTAFNFTVKSGLYSIYIVTLAVSMRRDQTSNTSKCVVYLCIRLVFLVLEDKH